VCNICHKTVCCCTIPVIVQYGKKGNQGIPGKPKNALPSWWYKALIVDFTHGNNATAVKYSSTNPYKSYDAARLAAVSGDTIVFMPGTHEVDTQLLTGVGIAIWAMPGAIINVNNAQVALTGTLNIQGDGEWHFFNDGINLDDVNELDVNATYKFYFESLYVHYSYGIATRVGDVSIKGKNIFIVDSGSTFLYANLWQGPKINIDFDYLIDEVEYGDSSEFSSNIYIRSSSDATVNINFKRINTVRRQCIVYLSSGVTTLNTKTVGDIVQISDNGADVLANSTIYVSSVQKANHRFYGNYKTNNPDCIIAVSATASNIPLKVYHEGSIDSTDGRTCVTIAGDNVYFKQKGLYVCGKGVVAFESQVIAVGYYNGFNILLPGALTSGGNIEINGMLINAFQGDYLETTCVWDRGDTINISKVRTVGAKMLVTGVVGNAALFSENFNQSLEIIGSLATNTTNGQTGYTITAGGTISNGAYTDDEIF
jgi:signal peptidase I